MHRGTYSTGHCNEGNDQILKLLFTCVAVAGIKQLDHNKDNLFGDMKDRKEGTEQSAHRASCPQYKL